MRLHRSQTVAILKKLTKEELHELDGYVHSSLSKATPSLRKSFDFLKSCAPDFKEGACNKEAFSRKVFGKKLNKASDKEINRLMHEIQRVAEDYILIKYAFGQRVVKDDALLGWFSARSLETHTARKFREIEQDLLKSKNVDFPSIYKNYLLAKGNQFVYKRDNVQGALCSKQYVQLLEEHYQLELHYRLVGLENNWMVAGKTVLEEMEAGKVEKQFLSLNFSDEITYYRLLLKFVKTPDRESYNRLKKELYNTRLRIHDTDRFQLATILSNKSTQLFKGADYNRECLAFRKFQVKLSLEWCRAVNSTLYRDMIVNLGHLRLTDEARRFQKDIVDRISMVPDIQNFIAIYNAHILFAEGKYPESLQVISNCKTDQITSGIDIKVLKIKLAFKMGHGRMLEAHINNFRKYFSTRIKKELSQLTVVNFLAMIRYTAMLFKIPPSDKQALKRLKKAAGGEPGFFNNTWVMEEIEAKLAS